MQWGYAYDCGVSVSNPYRNILSRRRGLHAVCSSRVSNPYRNILSFPRTSDSDSDVACFQSLQEYPKRAAVYDTAHALAVFPILTGIS